MTTPHLGLDFICWYSMGDNLMQRLAEVMDFDSDDANFRVAFKKLTKKYGREFIAYSKAAWEANDGLSEEEFCRLNGNMPKGFFDRKVKGD